VVLVRVLVLGFFKFLIALWRDPGLQAEFVSAFVEGAAQGAESAQNAKHEYRDLQRQPKFPAAQNCDK
jgi:hypothetical protein